MVFLQEFLEKSAGDIKSMKNYPACKTKLKHNSLSSNTTAFTDGPPVSQVGALKISFKTFANQVILDAFLLSADFYKINFFEKLFQEYAQSVNLNSLDSD